MSFLDDVDEVKALVNHDLELLGRSAPHKLGEACDHLCQNLRTLAGCALLADADTDAFHSLSARCGFVRLHFLRGCSRAGLRNPYSATGNNSAIFDVIAARHYQLAKQIAVASAQQWSDGDEYLDDFCLMHFVNQVVCAEKYVPGDLAKTLSNFKEALSGDPSAYFDVCQALLAKKQPDFDDAFSALITERHAELRRDSEKFYTEEITFQVKSRVFVEGLAFLNLAELAGLRISDDYEYCLPLARVQPRTLSSEAELLRPI